MREDHDTCDDHTRTVLARDDGADHRPSDTQNTGVRPSSPFIRKRRGLRAEASNGHTTTAPASDDGAISDVTPNNPAPRRRIKSQRAGQTRDDIHCGAAGAGLDHSGYDPHEIRAEPTRIDSEVHSSPDTQKTTDLAADGREDQMDADTHPGRVLPAVSSIVQQWRQRQHLHQAEKSLTLRIKAKCRGLCLGDKDEADVLYQAMMGEKKAKVPVTHPLSDMAYQANMLLIQSRDTLIKPGRLAVEETLRDLAKQLPLSGFIETTKGFDWLGLAKIVGSAGDIGSYVTVSKLWKRMGLAVIAGERQQKRADAEEALLHGYSPDRRAVMWQVGDVILKSQSGESGGPYREVYDARKAYEVARNEAGGNAELAASLLKRFRPTKGSAAHKAWNEGKLNPMHLHNRAKRYLEKRLLRDLWRAWRAATVQMATTDQAPLAEPIAEAIIQTTPRAGAPRRKRKGAQGSVTPVARPPSSATDQPEARAVPTPIAPTPRSRGKATNAPAPSQVVSSPTLIAAE